MVLRTDVAVLFVIVRFAASHRHTMRAAFGWTFGTIGVFRGARRRRTDRTGGRTATVARCLLVVIFTSGQTLPGSIFCILCHSSTVAVNVTIMIAATTSRARVFFCTVCGATTTSATAAAGATAGGASVTTVLLECGGLVIGVVTSTATATTIHLTASIKRTG